MKISFTNLFASNSIVQCSITVHTDGARNEREKVTRKDVPELDISKC